MASYDFLIMAWSFGSIARSPMMWKWAYPENSSIWQNFMDMHQVLGALKIIGTLQAQGKPESCPREAHMDQANKEEDKLVAKLIH